MADNTTLDAGAGGDVVATDDIGGVKHQRVKVQFGADGSATDASSANPLPVVQTGAHTVDTELTTADLDTGAGTDTRAVVGVALAASGGAVLAGADNPVPVSDNGSTLSVDDGAGSLTVDNAALAVTGGGVEATALRVTVASDSTGVLSVDDNGSTLSVDDGAGSLTVDNAALSVTGGGAEATALRVTVASDSTGVLSVDDNGGSLTVDGTVTANAGTGPFPVSDNGGSLTVDNGGTFVVQDSEKLADDAAFTVGTTKVQPVGFLADQASTDSVNEGDIGAARMTLDRKQIVSVGPSADTEGLSISTDIDLDETETEIKASAGKLYGWYIYNDGAAEVYVKLYNATAANVTVGTTVPVMTLGIPAGSAANVEFTNGIAFSTAICAAATTVATTADATAPAANQVVANFFYV